MNPQISGGLGSLDFLKDMGITVGKALVRAKSKDIERAIAAAKLFKPKNPSFMVILLAHNLKSRRLVSVNSKQYRVFCLYFLK